MIHLSFRSTRSVSWRCDVVGKAFQEQPLTIQNNELELLTRVATLWLQLRQFGVAIVSEFSVSH